MQTGNYIKCNDCGKFGNSLESSYWNGDMFYVEECPHCRSENIATVITKSFKKPK